MAFGTLQIADLLASTQQSVIALGEDRVFEGIKMDLDAHNAIVEEDLMPLVETSTDRRRRYGGSDVMVMEEMDEHAVPDAQKVGAGQDVNFPLKKYGAALQWTRDWLEEHTPSELAAQYMGMKQADLVNISRQIRNALMLSANYSTIDRFVDRTTINVKRLLNADGVTIPPDRYGNAFNGATHTHYLFAAALTTTILDALITAVLEHDAEGPIHVYINKAQEATMRGLAGFVAYTDPRIIIGANSNRLEGELDLFNIEDRRIGIYGAAEIWVKSWVPANYAFARDASMRRKPLVWRIRRAGSGALMLVADNENFPLRARVYRREFGVGVWNRDAAAVAYLNSGSAYTDPSL